jgi:hypothetical protein
VRDEQEEMFHGNDAWQSGPRDAILARDEGLEASVPVARNPMVTAFGGD